MAEPARKTRRKAASQPSAKKASAEAQKAAGAKPVAVSPVPASASAPKQQETAGKPSEEDEIFNSVVSPITGTWDFLKSGPLSLYLPLLKLNVSRTAAYLISVVMLIAGLFGLTLLMAAFAKDSPIIFFAALAVAGLAGGALILWMVQSFESAAFILVAAKVGGRAYSMRNAIGAAAPPTLRYAFLDLGLRVLVMVPGMLLFVLPFALQAGGGSSTVLAPGLAIAYVLFILYYLAANLVYEFLTQFWRYGFLLEGRGVVESLRRAFGLIRRFFVETLFFNLAYAAAFIVSSIPSFVFGIAIYFVLLAVQIVSLIALGLWGYVVYFAAIFVTSLVAIAFSTIAESVCRPMHYLFWKGISARMEKKD